MSTRRVEKAQRANAPRLIGSPRVMPSTEILNSRMTVELIEPRDLSTVRARLHAVEQLVHEFVHVEVDR